MLAFTGHPLIDVGLAALTAFAGHTDPDKLTEIDLASAADLLERLYTQPGAIRNFAKGTVFLNAGYTTSADPLKQHIYADRVLRSWRPDTPLLEGVNCTFCGQPAAYRATREEVPLLNGREVYNFSPAGQAGIPICGACSLAMQALPLACLKSGGGLIAAHSSDPRLTLRLAGRALNRMLKAITLSVDEKIPGLPYERTRLVEMLIEWLASAERLSAADEGGRMPSLTGCFFSNNGTSPSVRVYPLESGVVGFLEQVYHNADLSLTSAWDRAVTRAWVANKNEPESTEADSRRNNLYEALLNLPQDARMVLKRYLLCTRHWGLVALYLREVMLMDETRINLLKTLGERLAAYVAQKRAFFYAFSRTDEYAKWRRLLLRAADDHKRFQGQDLITFDEFVTAFTAPPGEINDWRLARDLVTLALIEARGESDDEPLFEDEPLDDESQEPNHETV